MVEMVKISKKTDEEMSVGYDIDEPRYPYGTELCFRDELVDQLGIAGLKVGDKVRIQAVAEVVAKSESAHQRQGQEEDRSKSMDLQLTDVAASPGEQAPDRTSMLYGDS